MKFVTRARQIGNYRRVVLVLFGWYVAQLVVGLVIIHLLSGSILKTMITNAATNVQQDLVYKDGTWDTSKYDADPEVPGQFRVYVVTKDGFVIDRWRPIPGYLDTSNLKQLLVYQTPQTVHTVTNQNWRVYSQAITNSQHTTIGAVAIGSYDVADDRLENTDQDLISTAQRLVAKIKVHDGAIDVSAINFHDVAFDTPFQVVDQYNRILIKSDSSNSLDTLPDYIDASYIRSQLLGPTLHTIKSSQTNERFLVTSLPLRDSFNNPVGMVIIGKTTAPFINIEKGYIWFDSLASLAILLVFAGLLFSWGKTDFDTAAKKHHLLNQKYISSISFDKAASALLINDHKIAISFATNQYYMCQALFGSPKKKWEIDELLEKFGDDDSIDGWRKVYDAMNSINKKTSAYMKEKVFVTNNRTYQLNPELLKKLK